MADINYLTQESFDKLRAELQELKTVGRSEIAKAISEAREKGDLKENAEYDAAKEAQGMHEAKIAKLENAIITARIIDVNTIDTSKVSLLSKVTIKNTKNKKELTYQLVSESEADLKQGRLSIKSPIASGILGKSVGETADIQTPGGVVTFEIINITV